MSLNLASDSTKRPLILDVDGTLIRNDFTHEMILEALKRDPLKAVRYARLGASDKTQMKAEMIARIGERMAIERAVLEPKIVSLARKAKTEGRSVFLCSGSEESLVQRLADELDFIDGAFGTRPGYNMTSENKADFLKGRFPEGFDYAGNSTQDFAVWKAAHTAYGVRPPNGTEDTRTATGKSVTIIEARRKRLSPLIRTLRPILWPGAIVAAFPSALAWFHNQPVDKSALFGLVLCCVSMLAALSVSDDLADIQRDRSRADHNDRPLAQGELSVPAAAASLFALMFSLIGLSLLTHDWPVTLGLIALFALRLSAIRLQGRSAILADMVMLGLGFLGLGALII